MYQLSTTVFIILCHLDQLLNTFRAIGRAASEDSDHLPMQGQSDFVVCGDKQAFKLQFLEISLVKYITVSAKV